MYECGGVVPRWLSSKESACNAGHAGDAGLIPGLGRSPGERHSPPLQNFCLENPMDRGASRSTVHRITKSWTCLKRLSMHACGCVTESLCSIPETTTTL